MINLMDKKNQSKCLKSDLSISSWQLGLSVHQKAASLQNPAGHCNSGPALSDGSLRIVKPMTNSHKTEKWDYSHIACEENKTNSHINVFIRFIIWIACLS